MPQMLHFLLQQHQTEKSSSSSFVSSPSNPALVSLSSSAYDNIKAAIRTTEQWMEDAPPKHVSPVIVKAKEQAVQRIQQNVLHMNNNSNTELDWGVICVYTCTKSCGDFVAATTDTMDGMGAYCEEYAWRQPAL
jgi:hypothetical protein